MTGDNQDVLEFLNQTKSMYDEDSANYRMCEKAIAAVTGIEKVAKKLAYIHQCIDLYCDREELHDESYWLDYILDPEWIDTDIGWTGDKMTPNQSEFPTRCDLISRAATIDAVENLVASMSVCINVDEYNGMRDMKYRVLKAIRECPSVQPEITDEKAIKHLQSSGWMQNHDKQMYEMGLKEQLADDSGSYDALLPSAQPDREDLVEKIKNGITASDGNNEYFIGLRNGMRWCLSLIDDKEPIYESSAQPDHSGDVNEMVESAYTEGYTAAESKYRKMWDEMQATKQDAVEDTWDLFQMISSAWYGKGCYYKQNDGSVYSRLSCSYMTFDDAVREFMEEIDDD